jgi:mRNA-decapping enzyme subunit 2
MVPAVPPSPSQVHSRKPSYAKPSSPPRAPSAEVRPPSINAVMTSPSRPSPMARYTAADLSPYIPRSAATPATIPKQMKYISMLESVAQEVERMTPKLERQAMAMHTPSVPARGSLGVPSPLNPMQGTRGESPVIYSSGPGPSTAAVGSANAPHLPPYPSGPPSSNSSDPFVVRPHTSSTYHTAYPVSSTHPNYTEEQSTYMMPLNGLRPPRPQGSIPSVPYVLSHAQGPQLPCVVNQPYPSHRPPPNQPNLRLQVMPSAALNEPAPLSAPVVSPMFNTARANTANNAHLLAILNAPAAARMGTGEPTYVNVGMR